MLIFLDLDGTILNTVHPEWKPYKDGEQEYPIEKFPFIWGAREFIISRKEKGDSLVIVSDSHPRYVNPIANILGLESICLADKPNVKNLNEFLNTHPQYKQMIADGNCYFIGDTKLDIEIGRRIGALTFWIRPYLITEEIKDNRDGIGDEMSSKKMGPTYAVKTFNEIESILENHIDNLYAIESVFAGGISKTSIRFSYNRYSDGSFACIRCLARQEQGACDKYARADKYFILSNPLRTQDFIKTLALGISSYINQSALLKYKWHYFTYLTDKDSTIPQNKMKEIFDMVETDIPKIELIKWSDKTDGSLRTRNLYNERKDFLEQYLSVIEPTEFNKDLSNNKTNQALNGKNIIVLDDQLTTAATAWHIIRQFKSKGAKNILFIAMFQMILAVHNEDMVCPNCKKPMILKIRRSDGCRFYSCTPPKYRGKGCGFIINILNQ